MMAIESLVRYKAVTRRVVAAKSHFSACVIEFADSSVVDWPSPRVMDGIRKPAEARDIIFVLVSRSSRMS